jgi:hypothetical protein
MERGGSRGALLSTTTTTATTLFSKVLFHSMMVVFCLRCCYAFTFYKCRNSSLEGVLKWRRILREHPTLGSKDGAQRILKRSENSDDVMHSFKLLLSVQSSPVPRCLEEHLLESSRIASSWTTWTRRPSFSFLLLLLSLSCLLVLGSTLFYFTERKVSRRRTG